MSAFCFYDGCWVAEPHTHSSASSVIIGTTPVVSPEVSMLDTVVALRAEVARLTVECDRIHADMVEQVRIGSEWMHDAMKRTTGRDAERALADRLAEAYINTAPSMLTDMHDALAAWRKAREK